MESSSSYVSSSLCSSSASYPSSSLLLFLFLLFFFFRVFLIFFSCIAGGTGAEHCLAGGRLILRTNDPFQKQGAPVTEPRCTVPVRLDPPLHRNCTCSVLANRLVSAIRYDGLGLLGLSILVFPPTILGTRIVVVSDPSLFLFRDGSYFYKPSHNLVTIPVTIMS